MKRLVEFPLEEGGSVLIEVEGPEEMGMEEAWRGWPEKVEQAQQTFEEALDKVRPVARAVLSKLRHLDIHDPPDEIEVEFGLKLDVQARAIVASAGMEANFKVTLTWKRKTTHPTTRRVAE